MPDGDNVHCPVCGHRVPSAGTDSELPVSYWGDDPDGPVEIQCMSCDAMFWVREWVTRTYTVGLTEEAARK